MLMDKPVDLSLRAADEHGTDHARARNLVSRGESNQHLPEESPALGHRVVSLRSSWAISISLQSPGIETPGIFLDAQRRKTVDREKDADPFHDSSEAEDIYDLFNATNGVVLSDGLLDISKLDEYSPEEAEALNVPRLREIWIHTKSGCPECEQIIRTLNMIRGTLREGTEAPSEEQSEASDTDSSIQSCSEVS